MELAHADRLAADVFRARCITDLDLGAGEEAPRTDSVHPQFRRGGDLGGCPERGHCFRVAPGPDQREPEQTVDGDSPRQITAALQREGTLGAFEHPPYVTAREGRADECPRGLDRAGTIRHRPAPRRPARRREGHIAFGMASRKCIVQALTTPSRRSAATAAGPRASSQPVSVAIRPHWIAWR